MPSLTLHNRYLGCLLGLAAGDAVGTTVEFRAPGSFTPLTDMVGGGPFNLQPGEWTDDTSMALCLAESLITIGDFDAADQMDRYLAWWRRGHLSSNGRCFDIGGTVSAALRRYEQTGDPFAGSADPYSAGNGSIMRLAPVPMRYAATPERLPALCADSSRTTHAATTCLDACCYFGGLIAGALRGEAKARLLAPSFSPAPEQWDAQPPGPEIQAVAAGSFREQEPPAIAGTGYVVKSLEAALWAFNRSATFEEGCLLAANLGDDADTTAAVYGQLAGAYYGVEGIPSRWLNRLAHLPLIEQFAERLLDLSG
jgi:ADP-ribosylglycohydrolase